MHVRNKLKLKEDLLILINKGKRTGKVVDEERFLLFTQQLYDISIEKIGPLDTIETYYLRCVYNIIDDPKETAKRETYKGLNFEYKKDIKDTVLWMILIKLAYHVKKDSEFGIAKEKESIAIDELEINGLLNTALYNENIHTVDQLIEFSFEDIVRRYGKITTDVTFRYMLYELYEVIHSLGYEFKGESKKTLTRMDKKNAEELLEKKVTAVSFDSTYYNKNIQTYLRIQKIYTLGDLVSFTTEELQEKNNRGKHMYNCLVRTAHDMGLTFADEFFIYMENPYFKKTERMDIEQEIEVKKQRILYLKEMRDKKQQEKEALESKLEVVNQDLEKIVNLIKEEEKGLHFKP